MITTNRIKLPRPYRTKAERDGERLAREAMEVFRAALDKGAEG